MTALALMGAAAERAVRESEGPRTFAFTFLTLFMLIREARGLLRSPNGKRLTSRLTRGGEVVGFEG